jgi:hypothetical protein
MRLIHVLDKLPQGINIKSTKTVIVAMIEDVYREGEGEIMESKEANSYIGSRTAQLLKEHLNAQKI